MISFTRSLSPLAALRPAAPTRLALLFGAVLVLSLGVMVAPAGAIVTTVGSHKIGLQPRSTSLLEGFGPATKTFSNPGGALVLPATKSYAIYWDPTDHYHGDWQGVIDTFFQSMGSDSGALASVFSVDAQYTDAANQHALYKSTFMGAYTDTDPYPTVGNCNDPNPFKGVSYPAEEPDAITCVTNAQIETELKVFIADHKLPTGTGMIFYLLTPPGVTVCLDAGGATGHCSDYEGKSESYENSFCSYHSDINPDNAVSGDSNTILYATIPWIAGGLHDGHLAPVDQLSTPGYPCQDGGFDPSSKPIEEKEKAKEAKIESKKEKEEHPKTPEEEEKQKEAQEKAEILEGPHLQEPNQSGIGPDGFPDTGLPDVVINQIGVEQQNTVTDPLLNAWKDELGNEATDECRDFFATTAISGSVTANEETGAGTLSNQSLAGHPYYLNDAFNLAALNLPYPAVPCLAGIRLEPKFTAPNPVNSGEIVGFDGMESDITLNEGTAYTGTTPKKTYAKYTWNFGDGTPEVTGFAPGAATQNSPETSLCAAPWLTPCAASTFHSYQYGGTYRVTLTVIDTGGNNESATQEITVAGPAAPSPSGGGSSGGSPAGTTSAAAAGSSAPGSPSSSGAPAKPALPGPVASAAVLSRSLSTVLKKGLVIGYSVNEQVAGQFQVLLAASVAKRIGLHGALATGMPPGFAPSIVIGKAILITTKGGRNTVKIQFGKKTAAKLRKLRRVSLTIRLVVRNASSRTPISTTVISTVNLSH